MCLLPVDPDVVCHILHHGDHDLMMVGGVGLLHLSLGIEIVSSIIGVPSTVVHDGQGGVSVTVQGVLPPGVSAVAPDKSEHSISIC